MATGDATYRTALALVALAALATSAAAEPVPDATLRAVATRTVRLELAGTDAIEGRVLAFEAASVTIARATSNEVVTLPRSQLVRVIVIETPVAPAGVVLEPERQRIVGVQMSLLGTLAVDAEYRRLRAFASTNLLMPILTASGSSTWYAGAVGAGVALPFGKTSRWKLDVFAQVLPFHTTSFYTYLGVGFGAGVHYTSASGFTVGMAFPVLGFSTRLGSSPYGYDASFRYNDSLAYYYGAALAGMPLLTFGYRFATNCPRRD